TIRNNKGCLVFRDSLCRSPANEGLTGVQTAFGLVCSDETGLTEFEADSYRYPPMSIRLTGATGRN
ncbi:MAG: hypothetical protein KBE10_02090, partial [Trichococcus sp.]|nr:hypothetical protein [Trichococcus sp.]MBP9976589.1 hypothetical protein [Trichococcus sp.]